MPKTYNLTGQRFGRLTVIKKAFSKKIGSSKRVHWECICDCGKTAFVVTSYLIGGHTKSCGCYRSIWSSKNKTIHGMAKTPEYETWCHIKKRCNNPDDIDYKDYGAKGISVCKRWTESFQNFYDDMGPRPSNKHSIDRIDNDGDYTPENCHWATLNQQANNKSSNVVIEIDGIKKTLIQWCEHYGINYSTVQSRIRYGWPPEKAVKTQSGCNLDVITFNGETKNLRQWAADLNMCHTTLFKRIHKLRWTIHDALTTPIHRRKK